MFGAVGSMVPRPRSQVNPRGFSNLQRFFKWICISLLIVAIVYPTTTLLNNKPTHISRLSDPDQHHPAQHYMNLHPAQKSPVDGNLLFDILPRKEADLSESKGYSECLAGDESDCHHQRPEKRRGPTLDRFCQRHPNHPRCAKLVAGGDAKDLEPRAEELVRFRCDVNPNHPLCQKHLDQDTSESVEHRSNPTNPTTPTNPSSQLESRDTFPPPAWCAAFPYHCQKASGQDTSQSIEPRMTPEVRHVDDVSQELAPDMRPSKPRFCKIHPQDRRCSQHHIVDEVEPRTTQEVHLVDDVSQDLAEDLKKSKARLCKTHPKDSLCHKHLVDAVESRTLAPQSSGSSPALARFCKAHPKDSSCQAHSDALSQPLHDDQSKALGPQQAISENKAPSYCQYHPELPDCLKLKKRWDPQATPACNPKDAGCRPRDRPQGPWIDPPRAAIKREEKNCGMLFGIFWWSNCDDEGGPAEGIDLDPTDTSPVEQGTQNCGKLFGIFWWSDCDNEGGIAEGIDLDSKDTSPIKQDQENCGLMFGIFRWSDCGNEGDIVEGIDSGSAEKSAVESRDESCGFIIGIFWWSSCKNEGGPLPTENDDDEDEWEYEETIIWLESHSQDSPDDWDEDVDDLEKRSNIEMVVPTSSAIELVAHGRRPWTSGHSPRPPLLHRGEEGEEGSPKHTHRTKPTHPNKHPLRPGVPREFTLLLADDNAEESDESANTQGSTRTISSNPRDLAGDRMSYSPKPQHHLKSPQGPKQVSHFAPQLHPWPKGPKRPSKDVNLLRTESYNKTAAAVSGLPNTTANAVSGPTNTTGAAASETTAPANKKRPELKEVLLYTLFGLLGFGILCLAVLIFARRFKRSWKSRSEPATPGTITPRKISKTPRFTDGERVPDGSIRDFDEASQRPGMTQNHAETGIDGVNDGWTKWIHNNRGAEIHVPNRFSPSPRTRPPRIPSLTLPQPTFATVRKVSGLPDLDGAAGHQSNVGVKHSSKMNWTSTV